MNNCGGDVCRKPQKELSNFCYVQYTVTLTDWQYW